MGIIRGDPNRLRRVLLNLAINAKQAMPDGGTFTLHAGTDDSEVVIRIEDTGLGIPEHLLDDIFKPFVSYGKHDGTGLGMTIAQRIVEAHGGTISARNRPEGGFEVTIRLPKDPSGR